METIRRIMFTVMVVALVGVLSGAAQADWDPVFSPDGTNEIINHKMHYPQLPDPFGWDVYADASQPNWINGLVADDWQCSETGPVDDIHIWGSWILDDFEGVPITQVHVSIHSDIPASQNPLGYSMPGELLWERDFFAGDFTVRPYGSGEQGFYVPADGTAGVFPASHQLFHQINIAEIPDPFIQNEGEIYWLDIQVTHEFDDASWGWKTSESEHFNDDAVWWDPEFEDDNFPGIIGGWRELRDPFTQESLDMAFVITPEPATLSVLGLALGGFALLRHKRSI